MICFVICCLVCYFFQVVLRFLGLQSLFSMSLFSRHLSKERLSKQVAPVPSQIQFIVTFDKQHFVDKFYACLDLSLKRICLSTKAFLIRTLDHTNVFNQIKSNIVFVRKESQSNQRKKLQK